MYSKIEKIKKIFLIILLGITALGLAGFVIYSACVFIKKCNRTANGVILSFIGAFSAITISNILLWIVFFSSGSYHNYGIVGVWYTLGVFVLTFLISGIVVSILNKKQ